MIYPGVYRGIVKDNDDRHSGHAYYGRCRVAVPQVYGQIPDDDLPWAWPAFPLGFGMNLPEKSGDKPVPFGGYSIPPVGAAVWVVFEHGNPQSPVYLGTWLSRRNDEAELSDEEKERYPEGYVLHSGYKEDGPFIRLLRGKLEIVSKRGEVLIDLDYDTQKIRVITDTGEVEVASTGAKVSVHSGERNDDPELDTYQELVLDPVAKRTTMTAKSFRLIAEDVTIAAANTMRLSAKTSASLYTPIASGFDAHVSPLL